MSKNHWELQFGAKRRAADKALLQKLERSLPRQPDDPGVVVREQVDEMLARPAWKERIARAFGRSPDALD